MSDLTQAMREYGHGIRGCYEYAHRADTVLGMFARAVEGTDTRNLTIEEWRAELGLCPYGQGHFTEFCSEYCEEDANDW